MMNLTPIGERIIVKIEPIEEKTSGGLVLPESAIEPPHTGEIVAVGSKVTELKAGDQIIFFAGTGSPIKGYPDLRLMEINAVQAVVA